MRFWLQCKPLLSSRVFNAISMFRGLKVHPDNTVLMVRSVRSLTVRHMPSPTSCYYDYDCYHSYDSYSYLYCQYCCLYIQYYYSQYYPTVNFLSEDSPDLSRTIIPFFMNLMKTLTWDPQFSNAQRIEQQHNLIQRQYNPNITPTLPQYYPEHYPSITLT